MKTKLPHMERRFQRHIAHTTAVLPQLEREIGKVGGNAESDLHHRLHHVEVMEQALRRNVDEVLHQSAAPLPPRVRKLRRLCRCIEKETENLRHEVDFLGMGSASTIVALVNGSNHMLERWVRRVTKMRPRRRLGS
jgi:hypothetical protein